MPNARPNATSYTPALYRYILQPYAPIPARSRIVFCSPDNAFVFNHLKLRQCITNHQAFAIDNLAKLVGICTVWARGVE